MNYLATISDKPCQSARTDALLAIIDAWGFDIGTAADRVAIASPRLWQRFFQTDEEAGMWLHNGRNWMPANAQYGSDGYWYRRILDMTTTPPTETLDIDNPL